MKHVTKIQTFDGKLHTHVLDARRHLDKLYGDALTKIAHQLCNCDGKYAKISEWLDENLDSFEEVLRIKRDLQVETEEG